VAALCAGLFGLPSLLISGHHFAITTYVMCELLRIALINGGKFTGAASGLDLPPIGTVLGVKLDKLSNAYMLVAAFMFINMLATLRSLSILFLSMCEQVSPRRMNG
jgi:branched-chain amino acid transport system permease protein